MPFLPTAMTNWKQTRKWIPSNRTELSDMHKNFPQTIPVFLSMDVFTQSHLPLGIFEPRYRQMVEHAMESEEIIGMIQPLSETDENIHQIVCLGKIDRAETKKEIT